MIVSIIISQHDDLDYYATISLIKEPGEPDIFSLGPYKNFMAAVAAVEQWCADNDDLLDECFEEQNF
jgi:hypothetical protein